VTGPGIALQDVSVQRGGRVVLHDVSLAIHAGEVTGLLGPSGSGKSTLIRAIAGVQAGVSGTVTVFDTRPGTAAARRELGYKTQAVAVYEDLSVLENLEYFAALRHAALDGLLERVGLEAQAHELVRNLSGGQRARVSLAAALVGGPRLLLLDEPTVGLDPLLRRELWRLFRELTGHDRVLLVSSHVLDEARHCDRLILLREGKLLAHLTPDELVRRSGTEDMDEAFVRLIEDA
jgi:ABC-2 type transport system ATP-binding protein